MQRLHPELLDDFSPLLRQGVFNATLKAHGLYSTFQFVLRLSPAVHRKLASMQGGIVDSSVTDLEGIEAFSTYLHETVHWWQHIGSTYGLMMSMTYPAQAHANYDYLRGLVGKVGFKKSIRNLAETLPGGGLGTSSGLANIIINNHFDMESFRALKGYTAKLFPCFYIYPNLRGPPLLITQQSHCFFFSVTSRLILARASRSR